MSKTSSERIFSVEGGAASRTSVLQVTPLDKLLMAGVSADEIERLKATMACIVYEQVGDVEVIPAIIQVPVRVISLEKKSDDVMLVKLQLHQQ